MEVATSVVADVHAKDDGEDEDGQASVLPT
jgi:hypothetical protein